MMTEKECQRRRVFIAYLDDSQAGPLAGCARGLGVRQCACARASAGRFRTGETSDVLSGGGQ